MSALKVLLEKALEKTNDSSEAKLLAEFIQGILDDNGDDAALVASSMCVIIDWASDFRRAAESSTFDPFKENT